MLIVDYDLRPLLPGYAALKRCKPLLVTEAVIGIPLIDQLLRILKVQTGSIPLALHIRTCTAVLIRPFIMDKPRLLKRMIDNIQGAFYKALLVRIFNPEHEVSALMLRDQICIERCP